VTRGARIGSSPLRKGNVTAIGIMLMAVGVFSGMDWGLKTLSTEYPPWK